MAVNVTILAVIEAELLHVIEAVIDFPLDIRKEKEVEGWPKDVDVDYSIKTDSIREQERTDVPSSKWALIQNVK